MANKLDCFLKKIKENYLNVCIAAAYTIIACLVYGIWSYKSWHLWYVTILIIVFIIIIGCVVGFIWIRSEIHKKQEIQNNAVEAEVQVDKE